MYKIGSDLKRVKLADLRPTQMTVGFRAVESKQKEFRKLADSKRSSHFFPVVVGPEKQFYILDGHHAAVALLREEVDEVQVGTVCPLSTLSKAEFWTYLDNRAWTHCYDAKGKRRVFSEMPKSLQDMADDPYRSLAAAVLDAGGFAKPDEPFYEFIWANYFRAQFDADDLQNTKFARTVKKAAAVARLPKAKFLPGWAGSD